MLIEENLMTVASNQQPSFDRDESVADLNYLKCDAILFDWDNTLVDTWASIFHAINITLVAFGLDPWTQKEAINNVQESGRDAFPKLFGEKAAEAQKLFYTTIEAEHLQGIKILEGAKELLTYLSSRSIPMGIVSNKAGKLLRKEVAFLGWDSHFGAIIGAGDAKQDKPAPDPALMALKELEVAPSENVWIVGDAPVDWDCALAAGCRSIAIGDRFKAKTSVFVSIGNCTELNKFFSKI
jgi:phosphoglycolate phosphatase